MGGGGGGCKIPNKKKKKKQQRGRKGNHSQRKGKKTDKDTSERSHKRVDNCYAERGQKRTRGTGPRLAHLYDRTICQKKKRAWGTIKAELCNPSLGRKGICYCARGESEGKKLVYPSGLMAIKGGQLKIRFIQEGPRRAEPEGGGAKKFWVFS